MSRVVIYTDGGSRNNPGKAASAAVIKDAAGNLQEICGKYLGIATNNVAEYTALLLAYESLVSSDKYKPEETEINFYTDSNLIANQLTGRFRIKNPDLAKLISQIKSYEQKFAKVTYQHVPREQNKEADFEVNRILDQN
ncbi:MAG TPA: ribonuclease HI family protein [Candidatus Saccharimonadales bacterium]|nr:ribonuclease HI family protein [Candidatus Saccharimonadales bacterium]